jgi:hypothetical protein
MPTSDVSSREPMSAVPLVTINTNAVVPPAEAQERSPDRSVLWLIGGTIAAMVVLVLVSLWSLPSGALPPMPVGMSIADYERVVAAHRDFASARTNGIREVVAPAIAALATVAGYLLGRKG